MFEFFLYDTAISRRARGSCGYLVPLGGTAAPSVTWPLPPVPTPFTALPHPFSALSGAPCRLLRQLPGRGEESAR